MSEIVNIKLKLTGEGISNQQAASKEIADNYERANRAAKSISAPRSAAAASAPYAASSINEREYGQVRGSVGTGAAGRDFAKQSQGLGGLVALYATFAANIFAVGAAYEALNKAAATERLAKATEMMSVSTGVHLKSVSKNLVEASGYALSFSEAMQFTNVGTSAGLASKQIESLTKIAKGAANALGRDVGDSVRRIIQGTAKQEQEILDELGIFIKASQAYDKFATTMNIKVADMTGAQRTQAYANEVERLGQKWVAFAEIPDPFSKFSATGKDALNELLTSVNKVFVPFIEFLSESKSGIQALIVLIATGLTRRALPEIGNVLNNLFTFDKARMAAVAAEGQRALLDAYLESTNKLADLKKKRDAILLTDIDKTAISNILGQQPTAAKGGISAARITTALVGPKAPDLDSYTKVEKVSERIAIGLQEQIKHSTVQDKLFQGLIDKKVIENTSTKEAVVLGVEGNRIAQESFKVISAENAKLAEQLMYTKAINLEKAREASTKHAYETTSGLPVPKDKKSTAAASSAATSVTTTSSAAAITAETAAINANTTALAVNSSANALDSTANKAEGDSALLAALSIEVESAAIAADTARTNANTLAKNANIAATTNAADASKLLAAAAGAEAAALAAEKVLAEKKAAQSIAGKLSTVEEAAATNILTKEKVKGMSVSTAYNAGLATTDGFNNKLAGSTGKWWATMKLLGSEMKAGAVSAGIFATAQISLAAASGLLGSSLRIVSMGLKGIMASLNAVLMPIMIAITVWELFGDKLAKFLPQSVQTAFGIGELAKAAEKAATSQKDFAEGTGLAAVSLANLNAARKGTPETFSEVVSQNKLEATAIQEQLDRIRKFNKEKKDALEAQTLDKARAAGGAGFSESAYFLEQLAQSSKLTDHQISNIRRLANEQAAVDRAIAGNQGDRDLNLKQKKKLLAEEESLLVALNISTQQTLANDGKLTASNTMLEASYNKLIEKAKKKGDTTLALVTPEAVDLHNSLKNIFDTSATSTLKFQDSQAVLVKMIQAGGKSAAAAAPLYRILSEAMNIGWGTDRRGLLVQDMGAVQEYLKKMGPEIAKHQLALAGALDVKPAGPAREYSKEAEASFRMTTAAVSRLKLEQQSLDKEFANTSALAARDTAVSGYQSNEIINATEIHSLNKANLDLDAARLSAANDLAKVTNRKGATDLEIKNALEVYRANVASAEATNSAAEQAAKIAKVDAKIAVIQAEITKDIVKRTDILAKADARSAANLAIERKRKDLAGIWASLSTTELANKTELLAVEDALIEKSLAERKAQQDFEDNKRKLLAKGGNAAVVQQGLLDLEEQLTRDKEALNSAYNVKVVTASIDTATTVNTKFKEVADSIATSFTDAFMGAYESGTSIFGALLKSVKSMFNNLVIRPSVQGISQGIVNGIASNVTGATINAATGGISSYITGQVGGAITAGTSISSLGSAFGESFMATLQGSSFSNAATVGAFAGEGAAGAGLASTVGAAAPYALAAWIGYQALTGGFESKKTWATMTGTSSDQFSATGDIVSSRLGNVDSFNVTNPADDLLKSKLNANIMADYLKAAKTLGTKALGAAIDTIGVQWSDERGNMSHYGISVGDKRYDSGAFNENDTAAQKLQVSRMIMTALTASELPKQLAGIFDNLVITTATQEQLDASMNAAIALGNFYNVLMDSPFDYLKDKTYKFYASLTVAAGSLDALQTSLSSYFANFYTDQEKVATATSILTTRFKDMGIIMPSVDKGLKDWYRSEVDRVGALDLSIQSNAYAYTSILNLNEAVNNLATLNDTLTNTTKQASDAFSTLEETIFKLRGDTVSATKLARERELAAIEDNLKAAQLYTWALEDEVAIKDKLTASINTNIASLKNNIKTLTDYSDKLKLGSVSALTPAQKYAEAKAQMSSLYNLASSVPTTDAEKALRDEAIGKISGASDTFLTMSRTMFASSEQYVQDYQSILHMLEVSGVDMAAQLSDSEKQLVEVQNSNSYLKNIDENMYSTAYLLQEFLKASATSEGARSVAYAAGSLASIPKRANGGYASGLTWVGENGPELANFTKPAMIYSNGASNDILNTKELVAEIRSLKQEVAQLRKDQQEQTGHIITTNYDANQKVAEQLTKSTADNTSTVLWNQRLQPKIS